MSKMLEEEAKSRYQPLIFAVIGIILVGFAVLLLKFKQTPSSTVAFSPKVENQSDLVVEIAGAVITPGTYKMSVDARIDDLIQKAGGLSDEANKQYVEKNINRAAKLKDGQKIYLPFANEQIEVLSAKNMGEGEEAILEENGSLNINSASQSELEKLWGIGPVTAQKIIEQRPYSEISELLSKSIVKSNVFERIKNQLSVN